MRLAKSQAHQGLIVIRYYLALRGAENGVTEMVTPFSASKGRFRNNRLGNHRNLYIIHEVKIDFYLLYTLATGFVRRKHLNLLDILIDYRRCQFRYIHLLLSQGDKGIHIRTHGFLRFQPFFRHFDFEL